MPDLRITWTCATCGDVETVTARARRHSATIGQYIPRGWMSLRGAGGKASLALCRKCRPPLRAALPPDSDARAALDPRRQQRLNRGLPGQAADTPADPTGPRDADGRCSICLTYGTCYQPHRCGGVL